MIEIPVGLKLPVKQPSLQNVELRLQLESAVEKAKLTMLERFVINDKFFPNGGGFNPYKNLPHRNAKAELNQDLLLKEAFKKVKITKQTSNIEKRISNFSNRIYEVSLRNALRKLKEFI